MHGGRSKVGRNTVTSSSRTLIWRIYRYITRFDSPDLWGCPVVLWRYHGRILGFHADCHAWRCTSSKILVPASLKSVVVTFVSGG